MTRDTKSKNMNQQNKNKLSKKAELSQRRKKTEQSDSDTNSSDNESVEMDQLEYKKLLAQMFPSKYIDKQIKNEEKTLKKEDLKFDKHKKSRKALNDSESETESDLEEKITSKKQKRNKKVKSDSETDDLSSDESSSDEDTQIKKKPDKINIFFTIGGVEDEDEDEDWETDEDDEDYSDEEDEEDDDEEEDEEEELDLKKSIKQTDANIVANIANDKEILLQLSEIQKKHSSNKTIQKCLDICEEEIKKNKKEKDKKDKKEKDKNSRIFRKNIKDKNKMNDFAFFNKLEVEEQHKIINELKEINKIVRIEKPYRLTLLESSIPVNLKAAALQKINSLKYIEPGAGEFYKIKNWVDTFMKIPFGKYLTLPISIEDGVDKCHDFMENAKKTLDEAVYGLNDAKMQIMQMLGQLIANPKAIGTSIAIHGPMGTGKTSIVKEGISKILNRPFAFIALGGATDSSFLEGHSYTYEGSTWGKILQIIIDSKCMNPVIYFDELDKISDTPKGEEIAGILTHLTDSSQNSQFHDKYFAEIEFDLSKCLFIFSYNDESKINPILKDRMYRIQTKGYNQKQKTTISNEYLLPKIQEQVKFNKSEIIIPDSTIQYIIDNLCNKEDGVRNLKRCLEIIYTKLNLYRLMKPGSNLFEEEMSLKVTFPFTVTKEIVDKLIKKDKESASLYGLYV
jgi:ATP-dependent Lon protease